MTDPHAGRPLIRMDRPNRGQLLRIRFPDTDLPMTRLGPVIDLAMTPAELGRAWAALTTAERKVRQPEYDAWRAAQPAPRRR